MIYSTPDIYQKTLSVEQLMREAKWKLRNAALLRNFTDLKTVLGDEMGRFP